MAAEAAGFQYFWVTEQHFFREIGHSPCPDMILSAVSQRTKTIRLGALLFLLPMYNLARLIEELCLLDHLSHGRLEIGVGRGISPHEFATLGLDVDLARLLHGAQEFTFHGPPPRAGTKLVGLHAHPVAAVKNDHQSTIRVSTLRQPIRSPNQPLGISHNA